MRSVFADWLARVLGQTNTANVFLRRISMTLRIASVLVTGLLILTISVGCDSSANPGAKSTDESGSETDSDGKANKELDTAPETIDPTDAAKVAVAILEAYREKDVGVLAELSNEGNRDFFAEIAEQGESHPRYSSIFQGWRWNAVQAWDGTTIEARQPDAQTTFVYFHELKDDDSRRAVVVLEKNANGHWQFEDIHSKDQAEFDAMEKVK